MVGFLEQILPDSCDQPSKRLIRRVNDAPWPTSENVSEIVRRCASGRFFKGRLMRQVPTLSACLANFQPVEMFRFGESESYNAKYIDIAVVGLLDIKSATV